MANLQILDLVILRDTGQKEEKDSLNFIHICALKKKKKSFYWVEFEKAVILRVQNRQGKAYRN